MPDLLQRLLQDKQVQLVDQAGTLQVGDEILRSQESHLGIGPPGEGFLVADRFVRRGDDRLIIDLDPLFADGPVQVGNDVLALPEGVSHFLPVVIEGGNISLPDARSKAELAVTSPREVQ